MYIANPSFISHYKTKECFFQVLAAYSSTTSNGSRVQRNIKLNATNVHFSQNHANISGSSLFDGLIDRCKLQNFSDLHDFTIRTMTNISNINISKVSSEAVQLL